MKKRQSSLCGTSGKRKKHLNVENSIAHAKQWEYEKEVHVQQCKPLMKIIKNHIKYDDDVDTKTKKDNFYCMCPVYFNEVTKIFGHRTSRGCAHCEPEQYRSLVRIVQNHLTYEVEDFHNRSHGFCPVYFSEVEKIFKNRALKDCAYCECFQKTFFKSFVFDRLMETSKENSSPNLCNTGMFQFKRNCSGPLVLQSQAKSSDKFDKTGSRPTFTQNLPLDEVCFSRSPSLLLSAKVLQEQFQSSSLEESLDREIVALSRVLSESSEERNYLAEEATGLVGGQIEEKMAHITLKSDATTPKHFEYVGGDFPFAENERETLRRATSDSSQDALQTNVEDSFESRISLPKIILDEITVEIEANEQPLVDYPAIPDSFSDENVDAEPVDHQNPMPDNNEDENINLVIEETVEAIFPPVDNATVDYIVNKMADLIIRNTNSPFNDGEIEELVPVDCECDVAVEEIAIVECQTTDNAEDETVAIVLAETNSQIGEEENFSPLVEHWLLENVSGDIVASTEPLVGESQIEENEDHQSCEPEYISLDSFVVEVVVGDSGPLNEDSQETGDCNTLESPISYDLSDDDCNEKKDYEKISRKCSVVCRRLEDDKSLANYCIASSLPLPPRVDYSLTVSIPRALISLNEPISDSVSSPAMVESLDSDSDLEFIESPPALKRAKLSLSERKVCEKRPSLSVDQILEEMETEEARKKLFNTEEVEIPALDDTSDGFGSPSKDQTLDKSLRLVSPNRINSQPPGIRIFDPTGTFCYFDCGRLELRSKVVPLVATATVWERKLHTMPVKVLLDVIKNRGLDSWCFDKLSDESVDAFLRFLWRVSSAHEDHPVVGSTHKMVDVILCGTETNWCPSLIDFVAILINFGADSRQCPLAEHFSEARRQLRREFPENTRMPRQNNIGLKNLPAVIRILTLSISKNCWYSPLDCANLVILLCWIALDPLVGNIGTEIELCIEASLNHISEEDWLEKLEYLCQKLVEMGGHHHNLVFIARCFPPSSRGSQLQRSFCFTAIQKLVGKEPLFVPNVSPHHLLTFLCTEKTYTRYDNYWLYNFFALVEATINAKILAEDREPLKQLASSIMKIFGQLKESLLCTEVSYVKSRLVEIRTKWMFLTGVTLKTGIPYSQPRL